MLDLIILEPKPLDMLFFELEDGKWGCGIITEVDLVERSLTVSFGDQHRSMKCDKVTNGIVCAKHRCITPEARCLIGRVFDDWPACRKAVTPFLKNLS